MPNFGKLTKNQPAVNVQRAMEEIDAILKKYNVALSVKESVTVIALPPQQEPNAKA